MMGLNGSIYRAAPVRGTAARYGGAADGKI